MQTTIEPTQRQKFPLGQVVATRGAIDALGKSGDGMLDLLVRHATGDWGDLGDDDKQLNEAAVHNGSRILSSYRLRDGAKLWVITESDRSATTLLLPEEY